jgi:nitronate monooxygenase
MISALSELGLTIPVLAAPMAGGPSTPGLVSAAARAGGIGFIAAGYQAPQDLADSIAAVRSAVAAFGVNVFAPNPARVDAGAFRRYAAAIQPDADRYGIDLAGASPVEDDDHWNDKIDVLRDSPVPVVSFTFGVPDAATIAALRKAGTLLIQTVTSAAEARLAADAGLDLLVVQSTAAGAHSGTFTPWQLPPPVPIAELIGAVRAAVPLPLIAAGGIATPADVALALRAGAQAAMVGTVLLRTDESGASAVHQAALADRSRTQTVVTRAFTGRPARALRNEFTDRYSAIAPTGYPALHHLTSPLRKKAAAARDAERVNLWAGTGYRHAAAQPVARVLASLTEHL